MTEKVTELFDDANFKGDSRTFTLLKRIKKKLGNDFLRNSIQKEASESRRRFEESIQSYFKYQIIMDAVIKTSYSPNNKGETIPSFYLNAIPKYAPQCEPSLPFSQENVSNILKAKKVSKQDIEKNTTQVENKIEEFCRKISDYSGQNVSRDWKKDFRKAVQFISSKAECLHVEDNKIHPQKLALNEMLQTYYKELTEGLTIMKKMLNLLERKFDFQLEYAEVFRLDSQCLLLKIRSFELKVMDSTYTEDALPALRLISNGMDTKEEELKSERDKTMIALEAYQVLGSEYSSLVETYQQLVEKISEQKWAISAFKSRTNYSG